MTDQEMMTKLDEIDALVQKGVTSSSDVVRKQCGKDAFVAVTNLHKTLGGSALPAGVIGDRFHTICVTMLQDLFKISPEMIND